MNSAITGQKVMGQEIFKGPIDRNLYGTAPVERKYLYRSLYPKPNLAVTFCGLKFENPFVIAASPPSDDLDMVRRGFKMGWAGAVLKTTSVEGNPVDLAYPMMSSVDHYDKKIMGLGNIDLISEHHIDVVEKHVKTLKREFPKKIVMASIMGAKKEDWQSLVHRLEDAGVDAIECSFSCPQGSIGEDPGKMLAQSIPASKLTATWVKSAAERVPVIIKITPQVTDIVAVARVLKEAGVDAIAASNTIPSLMGIDIETFVPYPHVGGRSTYSGLSGPAIKPITLRTIAEIKRNVNISISGTGGASTWHDAVEFMAVGAGIVQYCTAIMHYGFRIIDDLTSGLAHYIARKGFRSPEEIVGKALPNIVDHDTLPRDKIRSRIEVEECIKCDLCYVACRDGGHWAIYMDEERIPYVDDERCVGCGLCQRVCPVSCIKMEKA